MRVKKISPILLALCALLLSPVAKGQSAPYSQVMSELGLMQAKFSPAAGQYVSCLVNYYYSMQSTPTQYLDSLMGQYKLFGRSTYSKIGNTEFIQNDSVSVVAYNDDKTLMAGPLQTTHATGQDLFLTNLDSAFVASNANTVTITSNSGVKTMAFQFADSSRYYNCSLVYDSVTYVTKSLSYIMRSSKTAETGQPLKDGALVTILFTGYGTAAFDTTALNMSKYITIGTSGVATAQPAYSTYNFIQTAVFPTSGN